MFMYALAKLIQRLKILILDSTLARIISGHPLLHLLANEKIKRMAYDLQVQKCGTLASPTSEDARSDILQECHNYYGLWPSP